MMSDIDKPTSTPQPDLKPVLDVARAAIEQEFNITQRLEDKARNNTAALAGLFAIAQAVGSLILRLTAKPLVGAWWYVAIGSCAAITATAIVAAFYRSRVTALQSEEDVTPGGLTMLVEQSKQKPEFNISEELVYHYAELLKTRRTNNGARASAYEAAKTMWAIGFFAGLAELFVVFAATAYHAWK